EGAGDTWATAAPGGIGDRHDGSHDGRRDDVGHGPLRPLAPCPAPARDRRLGQISIFFKSMIIVPHYFEQMCWLDILFRSFSLRTAAFGRFCSLMGQGRRLDVSDIDACGCLRSLRAHVALDGVL